MECVGRAGQQSWTYSQFESSIKPSCLVAAQSQKKEYKEGSEFKLNQRHFAF